MIDLNEFDNTLVAIWNEMVDLGLPKAMRDRIEHVMNIVPNIEAARERRK